MTNTLGEFFRLQRGTTYKSRLLGQPGPVLLGLGSIARNGGFKRGDLKTYGGPNDPKILLGPGDIYVSLKDVTQSADLLGAVARVPDEVPVGRLTQDTVKLVFNEGAPKSYLYWLLQTPQYREYCRAHATGTTNLGLPREDFFAFQVPRLSPERTIVVRTLEAIEQKIELNRRMSETLDAMARAIFRDWFVDFGPTRAQIAGATSYLAPELWKLFPDRLEQDAWRPSGWTQTTLGQLLTVLETGGRPRGGVATYKSGVPSVGAESIVGLGIFDFAKTKFVPEDYFASMRRGHVEDRDVLLYKDGGRPGEFEPHATLVGDGFPFESFAINEHVYRLRVSPEFGQAMLYFWLTSAAVMEEMRVKGTGVAIPGLNSTQVKTLTVLLPPCALLQAFNEIVEPMVARILANCSENRTLGQTRDVLLPKLMSGEIRLRDAERELEDVA